LPGSCAKQRIEPLATVRSCAPGPIFTPSPWYWTTVSFAILPLQPDARWTASICAVLITTVTDERLTGPRQYQEWSTNETAPVKGVVPVEPASAAGAATAVTSKTTTNSRLVFICTSGRVWRGYSPRQTACSGLVELALRAARAVQRELRRRLLREIGAPLRRLLRAPLGGALEAPDLASGKPDGLLRHSDGSPLLTTAPIDDRSTRTAQQLSTASPPGGRKVGELRGPFPPLPTGPRATGGQLANVWRRQHGRQRTNRPPLWEDPMRQLLTAVAVAVFLTF